MGPQIEGGQKFKKQSHWKLQRPILKQPKRSFYVVFLLLNIKDDLKNFKWHSYSILICLKLIRNKKVIRFEKEKKKEKKNVL
jgi:hypothetical protein